MKWFTKKITVPESNETKEVDAIQLWEVRWTSLHKYIIDDSGCVKLRPELEAFPTEDEANAFAEALRNAHILLRQKTHIKVEVVRAR